MRWYPVSILTNGAFIVTRAGLDFTTKQMISPLQAVVAMEQERIEVKIQEDLVSGSKRLAGNSNAQLRSMQLTKGKIWHVSSVLGLLFRMHHIFL